jgi:hypothetical protein
VLDIATCFGSEHGEANRGKLDDSAANVVLLKGDFVLLNDFFQMPPSGIRALRWPASPGHVGGLTTHA